ncbi:BREX-2 system adenine-specific DNA-methyltransferase PglX [Mycolicibacterium gilvum]|uniref:site-specific DNA-methyltransferase (adenine-specific) n=1 Tax=Mycolicibacterium gilvum TaxID=1804 RepID=A0A378SI03_9MYCO|nr:BREX-2 system adenine-specific DNA-methyltransferase PglX [Mycolicibacterium gilvum]MCV7056051.1 BREX-2 system adenine-specific DNA-methyltransferase PglX [Mycolicibacterium gilvum]STZ41778.1 DNA methylase [Mycolicibacterium gilvum]
MGWAAAELATVLKRQVLALESDLRARVDGADEHARQDRVLDAWRRDYDAAFAAQRTAATWQEWRNDRVTQAAVAWVLLTVFARYCEDNALLSPRWIGGADADHRAQALDARRAYFQKHPEHTDREWLAQIIAHFGKFTATAGLVDRFSPLHLVAPSGDAARALLEFWWQQDDGGQPLYGFAGVDTRFLGDAYQDLSEHAKKTYALLQTPEFVEEFILDQTMEPALADRPLQGFTVIDPTCGSGHFLLGAFARLHQRWQHEAPALGARELVAKALDGIYGVDINPFAVAIARFRLLVAALHAAGDSSIEQNIGYTPHLAAGDSLLWGANQQLLPEDLLAGPAIRADATEDADALRSILQREHDVVVGNPPYITVKDAALNATYRQLYKTPHRQYALTVPFMELFFRLARGSAGTRPAGWVGQITSNSFMKREFGSKLIEEFLPTVDLQLVIDSEGAWIPGHNMDGTPTAILFGRNRPPVATTVRAVLSKGVRETPADAIECGFGPYWTSIVEHVAKAGHEDVYISVADLPRQALNTHPWSLSGGGAVQLQQQIDRQTAKLSERILVTGRTTHTGSDDAFYLPAATSRTLGLEDNVVSVILGEDVRDYTITPQLDTLFPYDSEGEPASLGTRAMRYLWPNRVLLSQRIDFQQTLEERGLRWIDHSMFFPQRFRSPLSIAFAFVATHNHFVLDRGGKVFKQSAPVVKLSAGASVEDHLRLLGVLNSSVACFWLKQNSQPKGGAAEHPWSRTYEFTGTTLNDFPLPSTTPIERATRLDDLAQGLQDQSPAKVAEAETPTAAALGAARTESNRLRTLLISQQEELDWEYYRIYRLVEDDFIFTGDLPGLALGERAFEIALARRMKDGEETAWFERHGSTPTTEIPDHFPADYRELLQRRLDAIESNPHIRLLEKPEYKRRWASEPWDKQVESALRGWLLDRVEDRALWFDRDGRPTPQSVAQLADVLDRDADFRSVLRLWAGDPNATTGAALAKLLADETVPFLAAYRYKPSGLDKRAAWEDTWALQRREDAGEKLPSPIPVPPKYKPADFVKSSYWAHRGKLDVPKERFIGYPAVGRDTDATELLGWAGWDHAQQALALASLISARIDEGWDTTRLVPLLAGLHELVPWVRQWHNQIDPEYGESVADTVDAELTSRLNEHHLTVTDLTSWRPQPVRRGRRAART